MEYLKKENQKPSFWAVLPASVRYNENIGSTAKLLFAEITALSNIEGYCWASNNYFANLYKISITQVSRLIKELEDNGFLKSFVDNKSGNLRKLYPQIINDDISGPAVNKSKTLSEKFDEQIGVLPIELKDERDAFLDYWTAKNDGGKKEHWQKQTTFALKQRWATWLRNNKKWAKPEKLPSDKEIREKSKAIAENKSREDETTKQLKEMQRPRTPEEQKRIDESLAKVRQQLANKFTL